MELPLPEIEATASPAVLAPGEESDITVEVVLDRSQPLQFTYVMEILDGGRLEISSGGLGTGAGVRLSRTSGLRYETAVWTAPDSAGEYRLAFSVSEQLTSGHTARDTLYMTVTE